MLNEVGGARWLFVGILVVAGVLAWWLRPVKPPPRSAVPLALGPASVSARPEPLPAVPVETAREVESEALSDPLAEATCGEGMALIDASACPDMAFDCLEAGPLGRCRRYAAPGRCVLAPERRRFCVDRLSYPNVPGMRRVVMVTFDEAREACRAEGKRLCSDLEWAVACEGPERAPTPCGFSIDDLRCTLPEDTEATVRSVLWDPLTTAREVARVDRREPRYLEVSIMSGFGVAGQFDGVSEWTRTSRGDGYGAGLKGRHFSKLRGACRPTEFVRQHAIRAPDIGFRCCSDPLLP